MKRSLGRTVVAGVCLWMFLATDHVVAQEQDDDEGCKGGSCPTPSSSSDKQECGMWMGPSPIKEHEQHGFGLGMFTGRPIPKGTTVESELLIPIYDTTLADNHPPLREYVWDGDNVPDVALEGKKETWLFIPGVGAIVPCTSKNFNLELNRRVETDSDGVHRSSHPSAGSFSYRYNASYIAVRDIVAGEELTVECDDDDFDGGSYALSKFKPSSSTTCVDDKLKVKVSSVAGRGLFTKKRIRQGEILTSTPLIPIHRKELDIDGATSTSPKQLLLNYCFGHSNSDLLLLPYGPLVNYVNHPPDQKQANAVIQWHVAKTDNSDLPRRQQHHHPELLDMSGDSVAKQHGKGLMMDIVALRSIQENEEVFIDYGAEWVDAWKTHAANWKTRKAEQGNIDANYVSAADFTRTNENAPIRSESEQETNPYPDNIQTACYSSSDWDDETSEQDLDGRLLTWWNSHADHKCLGPCVILDRYTKNDKTLYKAKLLPLPFDNKLWAWECQIDHRKEYILNDIPAEGIRFLDKPYTSDLFLKKAFRHEIGVPEGFYPENWMQKKVRRRDDSDDGDEFKRKKSFEERNERVEKAAAA